MCLGVGGEEEEEDSARMEGGSSGDLRWVDNRPQSSSRRARVTSFPLSLFAEYRAAASLPSHALAARVHPRSRRTDEFTSSSSSSSLSPSSSSSKCVTQDARARLRQNTPLLPRAFARHARRQAGGTARFVIHARYLTTHARSYYALTRPHTVSEASARRASSSVVAKCAQG